jgi:RNA polymerase sigma factor (sigma-70 family)
MQHISGAPKPAIGLRTPTRLLRLAGDERLVGLVRDGDERAFEILYDRHHRPILGFCRHMLGAREEAEDALQQTFLSAYGALLESERAIELRPWLFAIARNRCLSMLRARREHVALERVEPSTDGLGATVERREQLRELLGDLARLPADQRAALLLAELGTLDHAGIAAVLGCPRERVKALVFQARSSLIADREARATPCEQIRVELAIATGGALRRAPLRRHLQTCAGCRAFKAEIAEQRRMLALALPLLPAAAALKAGVLGGVGGAGAAGGAASGATAGGLAGGTAGGLTSGGLAGGGLNALAAAGTAKVAVSLTLAGAVVGGGLLTSARPPAPVAADAAQSGRAPASTASASGPSTHVRPASGDLVPRPTEAAGDRLGTAVGPPSAIRAPGEPGPPDVAGRTQPPTGGGGPAGPESADAAPPGIPSTGGQGTSSPAHSGAPSGQGAVPPGHGGTPPGQGGTPPGQSRTPPGQSGAPPGQGEAVAPGHGGIPPGQGGTPPGQSKTPPGQAEAPPVQDRIPPGHAKSKASSG